MSLKSRLKRFFGPRTPAAEQPPADLNARSFSADQEREAAFDTVQRGVKTVSLDRIVGSVGRYQDFDSRFRLKRYLPSEKLERIKRAMREGVPLPPVKLYQIREEYYAMDGNHRIAVAKELGHDEIRAQIVEFIPSKNTLENVLYREQSAFRETFGLPDEIKLTEIGQYAQLEKQIRLHQEYLNSSDQPGIVPAQAAKDWYETIYKPLTGIIKRGRLLDVFPERTIADLYVYISVHQWEDRRRRRYGIGIDKLIPGNMEAFREKMAKSNEVDYPEMKRGITAFIQLLVQARKEDRIVQKLFELAEVREVHVVHGDIDILVKVVLSRDLLVSDAETIGQFVHENIRQLSGVKSSKTLIPGFSKVKD
jgi:DNA-binding Lrp family transcriptional regulator